MVQQARLLRVSLERSCPTVALSATHVIPERVCARAHVHARADVRVCASVGVSECISVCAHLHPLQKLWHDSPAKVVTVLPKKEFE
jgi:hypothetical protein